MLAQVRRFVLFAVVLAIGLAIGAPALATPQFDPIGTERAHTPTIGPGIEFDTSGLLSGGQISFNSGTGILTMTGVVDTLNYYDPSNGSCPTDTAASNCSVNYAPDLDLTVRALLHSITIEPVFEALVFVNINFETTGDAFDLIITDPSDGPNNVMLKASFAAGDFDGTATTGLQTKILYNTDTGVAFFETVDGAGFLKVDGSTLHASLFDDGSLGPDFFGLALVQVTDFSDGLGGGLNELIAGVIAFGTLGSFTAETDGEAFAFTAGQFVVPEPSTALLLVLGLVMVTAMRKQNPS